MSASDAPYVLFPGGLAVPVRPVLLLGELEARGITCWRDGDDVLVERGVVRQIGSHFRLIEGRK